jgi:type IV pilus assembly protein PilF
MPLERILLLGFVLLALGACKEHYTRGDMEYQPQAPMVSTEKTDPIAAAKTNLGLAKGYYAQGQLKLAMEKCEKAIALNPKLFDAHSLLALIHEQVGQSQESEQHHKRAVELAPKSGSMNNNYGAFLCRRGRYEEADARFAAALADPFYETPEAALSNRGSCAMRWGKPDVAEQSLRESLKRKPDQPEVFVQLAQILFQKGDYLRARAFVQRYEATGKPSADTLELAMLIEEKLGNDGAVVEYRKRIVAEFPESDQAQRLTKSEDKG